MSKNVIVEFKPIWFDVSAPWLLFGTILKWCDTSQSLLFPKNSSNQYIRQLHDAWDTNAVMRTNVVRLSTSNNRNNNIHQYLTKMNKIYVKPILKDVGRTSWTCGFRIFCDHHGSSSSSSSTIPTATSTNLVKEQNQDHHYEDNNNEDKMMLLAQVETVMVNMDEKLTKSQPIPNVERISDMIKENNGDKSVSLGRPMFNNENDNNKNIFKFSTTVRITDCDALGHVNNAIYANMAEEFRYYVSSKGGYDNNNNNNNNDNINIDNNNDSSSSSNIAAKYATKPATTFSISYIGQALPHDQLDVSSWVTTTTTAEKNQHNNNNNSNESSSIAWLLLVVEYNFNIYVKGECITQLKLGVEEIINHNDDHTLMNCKL